MRTVAQDKKFRYPRDAGKTCAWLVANITTMVRRLQFGGTRPRT